MVNTGDSTKNPDNPENPSNKQPEVCEEGTKDEILFSPRFRSVAAMAGWDEEALLIASVIVEDTPDRQFKQRKRSDLQNLKTPPTNSRRKRRAHRSSPASIPVTVLDLNEDDSASKQESEKKEIDVSFTKTGEMNRGENDVDTKNSGVSSPSTAIPCMDRLREELSCAICLEICFEPSTTPCGHSFCRKCLRSAADKCGKKCPKCRHLISNGRYCIVNTVLWNTIQLLFPQEIEARKTVTASESTETQAKSPARIRHHNVRNRSIQASNSSESDTTAPERRNHRPIRNRSLQATEMLSWGEVSTRTDLPNQDEDAALALRLQREEFMESYRVPNARRSRSLAVARANLRAMASRAINIRVRGRTG